MGSPEQAAHRFEPGPPSMTPSFVTLNPRSEDIWLPLFNVPLSWARYEDHIVDLVPGYGLHGGLRS